MLHEFNQFFFCFYYYYLVQQKKYDVINVKKNSIKHSMYLHGIQQNKKLYHTKRKINTL
jgi:hypothetical protein